MYHICVYQNICMHIYSDGQFLSVVLRASCHRHGRAPVFLAEPLCHVYCTVTSSHSQVTKF